MTLAYDGSSRPAMCARLAVVAACLVLGVSLGACGVSTAHPPVMYATGQITAVEGRRVEADIGTHNGAVQGATLLIFDVANEQKHPRTGSLVRVELVPTGTFHVHDADEGRCVGQIAEGAPEPSAGQYVRLVHADAVPSDGWAEDAATWWRAIQNRAAIVGTDRTLPFYRPKRKRNREE